MKKTLALTIAAVGLAASMGHLQAQEASPVAVSTTTNTTTNAVVARRPQTVESIDSSSNVVSNTTVVSSQTTTAADTTTVVSDRSVAETPVSGSAEVTMMFVLAGLAMASFGAYQACKKN